jgi:hypothetical protein
MQDADADVTARRSRHGTDPHAVYDPNAED